MPSGDGAQNVPPQVGLHLCVRLGVTSDTTACRFPFPQDPDTRKAKTNLSGNPSLGFANEPWRRLLKKIFFVSFFFCRDSPNPRRVVA